MEEEEQLVPTSLLLELPIGDFERSRTRTEDYKEYLAQSDHVIQECKIIGVKKGETK